MFTVLWCEFRGLEEKLIVDLPRVSFRPLYFKEQLDELERMRPSELLKRYPDQPNPEVTRLRLRETLKRVLMFDAPVPRVTPFQPDPPPPSLPAWWPKPGTDEQIKERFRQNDFRDLDPPLSPADEDQLWLRLKTSVSRTPFEEQEIERRFELYYQVLEETQEKPLLKTFKERLEDLVKQAPFMISQTVREKDVRWLYKEFDYWVWKTVRLHKPGYRRGF